LNDGRKLTREGGEFIENPLQFCAVQARTLLELFGVCHTHHFEDFQDIQPFIGGVCPLQVLGKFLDLTAVCAHNIIP
jgi:hypothetical protein